jgi:hypothetical protein
MRNVKAVTEIMNAYTMNDAARLAMAPADNESMMH